jgi:RimJ/RimL family protein N-acetyltransferase
MEYHKTITLKDGRACTLRNGTAEDGQALLKIFNLTHTQTDYLLTYPEEHSYTAEDEAELLRRKTDSADEIELLAFVDGAIVGSAGVTCVGRKEKIRHRAEFGISVDKAYWGLGVGRALTKACIECAKRAEYAQLELEVVAENRSAIALYESVGFVEYGRNPKGFRSRLTAGRRSCSCGWSWASKALCEGLAQITGIRLGVPLHGAGGRGTGDDKDVYSSVRQA